MAKALFRKIDAGKFAIIVRPFNLPETKIGQFLIGYSE
jgi:hypothetical protein